MSFDNLSRVTEATRRRLAQLTTPGGILSPLATSRQPSTISFASPSRNPAFDPRDVGGEVGASGELPSASSRVSGGGPGDLSTFLLTSSMKDTFCLGVLAGGLKFCTLGVSHCTVASHRKQKAAVKVDHLYVASVRGNSAFINHHLDASLLSATQLNGMLAEKHQQEDWVQIFHAWNSQRLLKEEQDTKESMYSRLGSALVATAVTPAKKRKQIYDVNTEDSPPSLASDPSFGSSLSSADYDIVTIPTQEEFGSKSADEQLAGVLDKWEHLVLNVNKIGTLFRQIRSTFGDDIDQIQERITSVDAKIGSNKGWPVFEDCITAWDGVTLLHNNLVEVGTLVNEVQDSLLQFSQEASSKLKESKFAQDRLSLNVEELKRGMAEVTQLITMLGDEHEALAKTGIISESATTTPEVIRELQELGERIRKCESNFHASGTTHSYGGAKEIGELKAKLELLEARVPLTSLHTLGGKVFQSRTDVMLYVESKMPSNMFYLFHDAVTLLESLSASFQMRKDVLDEHYQSKKLGITAQEARHIASFRTTLPHVFGYVKDGTNTKFPLPALKSYQDWNSHDQDSGVKNYIIRGMADLSIQIPQDIANELVGDQWTDARMLANSMHSASQEFIARLSGFFDEMYNELLYSSGATADEAHELVSAIVRRIFENLKSVRTAAANALSDPSAVSKCATYMWCMIQAHKIQQEYLDSRFRNHPSIAPVIILHVFRTRVTQVTYKAELKRLEGRVAALERPKGGKKEEKQDK